MATMAIDAAQISTTNQGGRMRYEVEGVTLFDIIGSVLVFTLTVIISLLSERIIITSSATANRKPNATPGRVFRVWARCYVRALWEPIGA